MSDATVLLRDIAGDAAGKAANKVNPSEDQLNQIDQPAEDNTWHEAPKFGEMKNQYKDKFSSAKGQAKDVGNSAAGDATQAAHPDGSRDPAEAADLAARDQQQGTDSGVDAKTGAKAGAKNVKNNISGRMDEDQKEKARQYRERTNEYFKKKLPKDRREQVVFRLKKMIVEIQSHRDCKLAVESSTQAHADHLRRHPGH